MTLEHGRVWREIVVLERAWTILLIEIFLQLWNNVLSVHAREFTEHRYMKLYRYEFVQRLDTCYMPRIASRSSSFLITYSRSLSCPRSWSIRRQNHKNSRGSFSLIGWQVNRRIAVKSVGYLLSSSLSISSQLCTLLASETTGISPRNKIRISNWLHSGTCRRLPNHM